MSRLSTYRFATAVLMSVLLTVVLAGPASAQTPYQLEWTRQFGSSGSDHSVAVACDAMGNTYVAGYTKGDLDGSNAGETDAFVSKYTASGTLAWTRQLGTPGDDRAQGVACDIDGNVFITGYTFGGLDGVNSGQADAFVSKFTANGTLEWIRQVGTTGSDSSVSIAIDHTGNAFITGYTNGSLGESNAGAGDAFVTKYTANGTLMWTRQLGSSNWDRSHAVATDPAGNLFITGYTDGNLGGTNIGGHDVFISKYMPDGTLAWTRQLGTPTNDYSYGITTDAAGNLFITGNTLGQLSQASAGAYDAFVSKYTDEGVLAWTRQIGTAAGDFSTGVASNTAGELFITGFTAGALDGENAGSYDAFVSKLAGDGTVIWTRQIGTSGRDTSYGVATDAAGNLFITGYTMTDESADGDASMAGNADAFVMKFTAQNIYKRTSQRQR